MIQRNTKHLIEAFEAKAMLDRPFSTAAADYLVAVIGTAKFFYLSLFITVIWLVINSGLIPGVVPFDPFPFILLTMVASVGAIFMTVIILVSQNRQANINTLRSEILLQMILISEKEITKALNLLADQMKTPDTNMKIDRELKEMLKETDVDEIEKILEQQLSHNNIKKGKKD